MQVWAEDILQYHDLNRDKQVAVEELAHGLLQWHLVQYRMKVVRSYNSKHRKPANWVKETIAFEKDVLERFYCEEGSSCKTLDEISAYGETLKGKKAKLKKQRIQGMFESEEGGDQEELMFVDRETGEMGSKKVGQIKAEL